MKRCLIILLAFTLLTALFTACSDVVKETPPPVESVTQTPSQTPVPDFSGTNFMGEWHVSKVIDSEGTTAGESEMQEMGADFTMELLEKGVYFVYNADGKVLGQGAYSVSQNKLILNAGGKETIYEIQDEDTLQSASVDGSITVMSRTKEETPDESEEATDAPDES